MKPAETIMNLFRELLDVPSPSGREAGIASLVRAKLEGVGLAPETDPAGNVVARIEGADPALPVAMLAAHMDEVGMAVTEVEEGGTLRVQRSGGLYPWKLGETPVVVLGDKENVPGLLGMGSTHVPGAGERRVTWETVRLFTGLTPARLAEAGVGPGTPAVPAREARGPVFLGEGDDPLVGAWTFDDRMGVVNLLRLAAALAAGSLKPRRPLLVAFTVQEEIGGHGARLVAARERPGILVAVDGCPVLPGGRPALDGRPGVWTRDALAPCDPALVAGLCRAAEEAGTAFQKTAYAGARSDASMAFASGMVPRHVTIGHIRDSSHGFEVARLSCFENLYCALRRFVEVL